MLSRKTYEIIRGKGKDEKQEDPSLQSADHVIYQPSHASLSTSPYSASGYPVLITALV